MTQPKLVLFVDVISPFAYMAFHVIKTSPTFKACDVSLIPIFLGGVMQKTGNRPPMQIQGKAQWIAKERDRWVKRFNIPIADKPPQPFPQPTLRVGRALCAIQMKYPQKLTDAYWELSKALWIERQTIDDPQAISGALSKLFSEAEVEDVLDMSAQPEAKKRLTDNTNLALEEGAFGLPYYLATNSKGETEAYWGFDHLGQAIEHLGLKPEGEGFRAML